MRHYLVLGVLPWLTGCALSHEHELESGLDGEPIDAPEPECSRIEPTRVPLVLGEVYSAAFVGPYLHLDAEFDGRRRYAIAEVAERAIEVLGFARFEGPATWARVHESGSDRYVRMRPLEGGVSVEILDVQSPLEPDITAELWIPGVFPEWERFFGGADNRVFFCLPSESGSRWAPGRLGLVSIDPLEFLGLVEARPCSFPFGRIDADVAISWGDDGDAQADRLYDGGATRIVDYFYNPDGIHQYGSVRFAATDGSMAVLDPESPREFFLFDLSNRSAAERGFMHAYFPSANGGRLLDTVDNHAYFATASGVIGFSLGVPDWRPHDWAYPPQLDWTMEGEMSVDSVTPLASSSSWLILKEQREGADRLYVVPLAMSGTLHESAVLVEDRRADVDCP